MMELVDFSDPGLVVLPIHRLVRGIAPSALAGLEKQLENFFILESVPLTSVPSPLMGEGQGEGEGLINSLKSNVLAVLGLESGCLVCLKQRQGISIGAMMPGNRSRVYREFNVSILNHIILDKVLSGAKDLDIAYTVNTTEVHQQVRERKYQLAFLLNPPQPEMVKAVADAKDRMPRKSTYFYPKLPAGLIINYLEEES